MKVISYLFFSVLLIACSETNTENKLAEEPIGLTKDSLKDISGLNKLLARSIHPILFDCDTLVLDNVGPLNCAQVSDKEKELVYFPLAEDSAEFSKVFKLTGKNIFYASSCPKDLDEERVVKIEIEGRIVSGSEILIVENYNKYPSSGHIEKLFTFSNGKWTYFLKDSSWMSPIFVDTGRVGN